MTKRLTLTLLLALAIAFSFAALISSHTEGTSGGVDGEFAPGRVVVILKPEAYAAAATEISGSPDVKLLRSLPGLNALVLSVPIGSEYAWIQRLKADPRVRYAGPDHIVRALGIPNDPHWSQQWNMPQIKAPQAWDATTGSSDVIIAIIDTGVDLDHPEFSGKIVQGYDFVNDDNVPDDDNGHGTHVAGIAAARGNNGQGVAGVAWNVKIMPLKVLDASGNGYESDLAQAVSYAADHGARVINMSLGTLDPLPLVENAVRYAYHTKGCLLVAAAGNDGKNQVMYPAAYPEVMAVVATNKWGWRTTYSHYGPQVEVAAPGGDTSDWPQSGVLSTYYGGNYAYAYGTSMATPHVAGQAALIWSIRESAPNVEIRRIITSTAVDKGDPGKDDYYGYGLINVCASLQVSPEISPARFSFLVEDPGNFVPGDSSVVGIKNRGCVPWDWEVSEGAGWMTVSPITGTILSGETDWFTVTASIPGGYGVYTGYVFITATSLSGMTVTDTVTVTLSYTHGLYRLNLPLVLRG